MKKNLKYFVFPIAILLMLLFSFANNNCAYAESATIVVKEISSIEDLQKIGKDESFPISNVTYFLTTDLNLSDADSWIPINNFSGVFDGNGFTISNLKIDGLLYNYGFFANTKNATIKNLKLDNVSFLGEDLISDLANQNFAVFAGGIVGKMENTKVEQCSVSFSENESDNETDVITKHNYLSGQTGFYFGGIAGEAVSGSQIINSSVQNEIQISHKGSQAVELNIGGICGNVYSSKIINCYALGNVICDTEPDEEIQSVVNVAIGGIAGYVSGCNSEIINTYFSGNLNFHSTNDEQNALIGATIGKVTNLFSVTPKANNINYLYAFIKNNSCSTHFGQSNNYLIESLTKQILTSDNFSLFQNEKLWSIYYPWDFEYTFTNHIDGFPTLQIFNTYEIILNVDKTIIDLGDGVVSASKPVELNFLNDALSPTSEEDGTVSKQFKNKETVEVQIKINEDFAPYYKLQNVLINNSIIWTENNPIDGYDLNFDSQTGNYILSYIINDKTAGEISVALEKIELNIVVQTDNILMGKVRNQYSTTSYQNFSHTLTNGNTYRFFAIPVSSDFAFQKWVIETLDEQNTTVREDLTTETLFNSSQLSFVFGMNDETNLTSKLVKGGKLTAVFSSNICKVSIITKNADKNKDFGSISYEVNETKSNYKGEFAVLKQVDVTLIASAKEGYKFVEWLDENNRTLSSESKYVLNSEEDEIKIYASFKKIDEAKDLTVLWIVLGCVGGVIVIGGIIWLIIAKRRDNSYKNFY